MKDCWWDEKKQIKQIKQTQSWHWIYTLLKCHYIKSLQFYSHDIEGAQWLSGRVLDSRPKGRGLEPHPRHCVVSLSKNINPSLVLVQPRKTRPFITERLLLGRKESNQTNKQTNSHDIETIHCCTVMTLNLYLLHSHDIESKYHCTVMTLNLYIVAQSWHWINSELTFIQHCMPAMIELVAHHWFMKQPITELILYLYSPYNSFICPNNPSTIIKTLFSNTKREKCYSSPLTSLYFVVTMATHYFVAFISKKHFRSANEPVHEISNNVVWATSKASDQPAHTRSLIRAFACRLSILWLLSYWLNSILSF